MAQVPIHQFRVGDIVRQFLSSDSVVASHKWVIIEPEGLNDDAEPIYRIGRLEAHLPERTLSGAPEPTLMLIAVAGSPAAPPPATVPETGPAPAPAAEPPPPAPAVTPPVDLISPLAFSALVNSIDAAGMSTRTAIDGVGKDIASAIDGLQASNWAGLIAEAAALFGLGKSTGADFFLQVGTLEASGDIGRIT